ncbi:hypothetical protein J2Z32_002623 [Paenibacillus turicensis]|uniref:Uncharacterized protein n=1 Tax=Paenibacillus turicensis TaxID=160487 RepID=A0ABS4FTS9_9BACL|nr:hypothetical protein [Paenibacillus turicensis]MBP1905975.1 hypothetical protein [Paenibacillus turicensis]
MGRSRWIMAALAVMTVLAVVVIWYTGVFDKKKEESFVVKDISGDSSLLSQVKINGVLRNGKQATSFDWIGHEVKATTQYFRKQQPISLRPYTLGDKLGVGDKYYTVYGEQNFEILEEDQSKEGKGQTRSAVVPSSLAYQLGKVKDDKLANTKFTNPLEYGLTDVDDKMYFIVPNNAAYAGINSIYQLDFKQKKDESSSRKLATIDLKENALLTQKEQPRNIEVLGLESVGKQLAVVMSKDGKLVIQAYDSVSGKETGMVEVKDVYLQTDLNDIVENSSLEGKTVVQSYGYNTYRDEDNGVLNLSFNLLTAGQSSRDVLFVTIDMKHNVSLLSVLKSSFSNPRESATDLIGVRQVAYIQNHLYLIRMEHEQTENQEVQNDQVQDVEQATEVKAKEGYRHLYVYVYNASGLVYKGELVTSMNDDYVSWLEDTEGYHSGKYRFYEDWKITRVSK